ncbi:sugar porter family MFS transporter [Chitinophaga caseinilytica]|uniref:Sugar porter family MFS transporter n=1 Tax=Chitinophaga caseinilytica TaxID=2267521 RepID=A0ABZ2Z9X7_9BACT
MNPFVKYVGLATFTAALGGLLFGFDMAVISGALLFVKDQFQLTDAVQGWFVSSALVGCIAGVAVSGVLSDRLGRKKMLAAAAVLFLLSAAGSALSPGFTVLVLARIAGGVGVGIASIVAPLYISEIAPAHIRGRLVTLYQLAITAGILLAYLTNAAVLQYAQQAPAANLLVAEPWRAMIGIGGIPSLLFIICIAFIPESPRWLLQTGRTAEGMAILQKMNGNIDVPASPAAASRGAFRELFSPALRKPMLIGILLPLFSQFSGINAVIYYGPRILNEAGINISNALLSQTIFGIANFVFTLIAIWKVDSMGRRPLYMVGSLGAAASLIFAGYCMHTGATGNLALVVAIILFLACFAFSLGPLKFVIASEIYPTHIRGQAMAVSLMTMWVADSIVGQLTPVLLGKFGGAATFWFFACCCLLAFWTVLRMVPETKGRSLEAMDDVFKAH